MGHPVLLLYKTYRFTVLAATREESDRQKGEGVLESVLVYVQLILQYLLQRTADI